ncbi:hypothetical protein MC7420_1105 [Coleofasciculus chthonoplastes PCC 7420]|uniref:Uncharacterized protein n=1 Tax=Coleofasciculus chthonoplastes PCC 7420 TaxID=118168 RepID=B4VXH9_9CYAN|nr:hypothetical protein MC7420_1105 [Coleofasciculus chthonoplastes PCC 7420]
MCSKPYLQNWWIERFQILVTRRRKFHRTPIAGKDETCPIIRMLILRILQHLPFDLL